MAPAPGPRPTKIEPWPIACSECGKIVMTKSPATKTCSDGCRQDRHIRRVREEKFQDAASPGVSGRKALKQAKEFVQADVTKVALDVMGRQLEPIVKEALTKDVLDHIAGWVSMVPELTEAMARGLRGQPLYRMYDANGDLHLVTDPTDEPHMVAGEHVCRVDPDLQYKYAAMLAKYTVGQQGLAPQPDTPKEGNLTVVFPGMPAPAFVESDAHLVPVLEAGEAAPSGQPCDMCGQYGEDFVAGSQRCRPCHDSMRAKAEAVAAQLGKRSNL